MSTPRLIQVKGTNKLYMNQALYDFMKKCLGNATGALEPDDKIYFFKNVDFKRDKLQISEIQYHRVIKIEKADAVVINTSSSIPSIGHYLLTDNTIQKDHPGDESLIADVVFNLNLWNSEDIDVIQQFYKLSQLPKLPKLIESRNLASFINSGLVIDEYNLDEMEQMLQTNKQVAYALLNSCNIPKSISFLLYLIYFPSFSKNRNLTSELSLVVNHCSANRISLSDEMPLSVLEKIRESEFLKDRLMRRHIDRIKQALTSASTAVMRDTTTIEDVIVKWNLN